jgi:hypothetical protein
MFSGKLRREKAPALMPELFSSVELKISNLMEDFYKVVELYYHLVKE